VTHKPTAHHSHRWMGRVGLLLLLDLGLTYAFLAPSAGLLTSASPTLYKAGRGGHLGAPKAHGHELLLSGHSYRSSRYVRRAWAPHMSSSFGLSAYLRRIGLELSAQARIPSYATLAAIMDAQSRAIPFENLDVVQRKIIDISPAGVEQKLVSRGRGGYCFEQNQLLASALLSVGFDVSPMLCRVRWNKAADEQTTFTHVALSVKLGQDTYLADVVCLAAMSAYAQPQHHHMQHH
jgi:hypothetical protein